MRFLHNYKADAAADLVYRVCPLHLLEPVELIKDLRPEPPEFQREKADPLRPVNFLAWRVTA